MQKLGNEPSGSGMGRGSDPGRKAAQMRRRARTVALLFTASAFCWLVWGAVRNGVDDEVFTIFRYKQTELAMAKRPGTKYILLWNEYFNYPNLGFGTGQGTEIFEKLECPVKECFMTADNTLMPAEEYDAVVIHMYFFSMGIFSTLNTRKLPPKRRPEQRYIFFLLESPANCGSDYKYMEHLFNWTMTYRSDSDIVAPYGIVVPLDGAKVPSSGWLEHPSPPISPSEAAALVTKESVKSGSNSDSKSTRMGPMGRPMVAWMVSHCITQGRREEYVAQLSNHIQVDVFGGCGKPWPKGNVSFSLFLQVLKHSYKFYLSFENSLCRDYVTEKLFNILDVDVIPVVYGAANYSAVAPPYSYIDARQFKSPRHLAEYLHFLARHPNEYRKFFWWKNVYKVVQNPKSTLCNLCAKLHEPLPPKTYKDMKDWWHREGTCVEPKV